MSVYTYDEDTEMVVLIRGDLTKDGATFVYQSQRATAREVYVVHHAAYVRGVERALTSRNTSSDELLSRTMYLHSTGRCGSTLLSRLLDKSHGVISLAEPDIYSALTLSWRDKKVSDQVLASISRAASLHLAMHLDFENTKLLAIKFRSFVTLAGKLMHESAPKAKVCDSVAFMCNA